MLLSVILYGSRARGDHRAKSDVDLLGIIESGTMRREVSAGGVSMYHYPAPLLLQQAQNGNLFALHLVKEGKVLHDTIGCFAKVREAFRFKESYEEEIVDASMIVRFLLERPHIIVKKAPKKRLVWGIRTILIARAAERELAFFSSSALASFSKIPDLKDALDNRNLPDPSGLIKMSGRVLRRFGSASDILDNWPESKPEQRALMLGRGGIAADTVRFVQPQHVQKPFSALKTNQAPAGFEFTYFD